MKIIFVYNADSGFVNALLDIGHKAISPNTYACNLCQLTYGAMTERKEWKRFRESSNHELEFLHRDEFEKKYREKREYPVILKMNEANAFEELISKNDLNALNHVNELIQKLKETA